MTIGKMLINNRMVVALASCFLGFAMMYLGVRFGSKSPEPVVPAEPEVRETKPKKTQPAWNIALGNIVLLAPELGFQVTGPKADITDTALISAGIEGQLSELRDLYREASDADPHLMGGILIEIEVDSAGTVVNVKDLVSRIPEGDFKRNLIQAVSKWNFSQAVSSPVTIRCPLIFVRQGMEITTLLTWEKSLRLFEHPPTRPLAAVETANNKGNDDPNRLKQISNESNVQKKPVARPNGNVVEIRSAALVRKEPSYRSPSISEISKGTRISVVKVHGDWLEIRVNGSSGFIPRDFATPVEEKHQ